MGGAAVRVAVCALVCAAVCAPVCVATGGLSQRGLDSPPVDAVLRVLVNSEQRELDDPAALCTGVLCGGVEARLESLQCVGLGTPTVTIDDETAGVWQAGGWSFAGVEVACGAPSWGWSLQFFETARERDLRGDHEMTVFADGTNKGIAFDEALKIARCDFPRCVITTDPADYFQREGF